MGAEELKVRREMGWGRREETGPDGSGGTEGEGGGKRLDQMGAEELKVRRDGGSESREETRPDGSGGTEGKEDGGSGSREETRPDGSGGTAIYDVGFITCRVEHVLVAVIVLTLPAEELTTAIFLLVLLAS